MTHLVFILVSVMVLIVMIMVKVPLLYWYRKFRIGIWHRWIIWKLERNLNKNSIEPEKISV